MKTIKSERIRLGLTQHQLADLLGIPFRTIQNWETGQRKCPDYVERLILEKMGSLEEPERKQAHWIYHTDELFPAESKQECSNCHEEEYYTLANDNFCPNCGAKMSIKKEG